MSEGVNGHVYHVELNETFEQYAIKKLTVSQYSERELKIWRTLNGNENIVKLNFVTYLGTHVLFFMEYMQSTLRDYITFFKITSSQIESIFYQIVNGLFHCHDMKILHRDIKPENILLNYNGTVKICDFGLSRFKTQGCMTMNVVSLWYKAPELLLKHQYSENIDIWSAGCIFVEMINRKPLFRSNDGSEEKQLEEIINILGSQGHERNVFHDAPFFLKKIFVWNSNQRISSKNLKHCLCNITTTNFDICESEKIPLENSFDIIMQNFDEKDLEIVQ